MNEKNLKMKRIWILNSLKAIGVEVKDLKDKIMRANKRTLNLIKRKYLLFNRPRLIDAFSHVIEYSAKYTKNEFLDIVLTFVKKKLKTSFSNNKYNEKFNQFIDELLVIISSEEKRIRKHKGIADRQKSWRTNNLEALKIVLLNRYSKDRYINRIKLMRNKRIEENINLKRELLDLIEYFNFTHSKDTMKYTQKDLEENTFYSNLRDKYSPYMNHEDYSLQLFSILEDFLNENPKMRDLFDSLKVEKIRRYPVNVGEDLKRKYRGYYTYYEIKNNKLYNSIRDEINKFDKMSHFMKYGLESCYSELNSEDRIKYNENIVICKVKGDNIKKFMKRINNSFNKYNVLIDIKETIVLEDGTNEIHYTYRYNEDQQKSYENILKNLKKYYSQRRLTTIDIDNMIDVSFVFNYEEDYMKYKKYVNWISEVLDKRSYIRKSSIFPYNQLNNQYNRIHGHKPAYKEVTKKLKPKIVEAINRKTNEMYETKVDLEIKVKKIKKDLGDIVSLHRLNKKMGKYEKLFVKILDIEEEIMEKKGLLEDKLYYLIVDNWDLLENIVIHIFTDILKNMRHKVVIAEEIDYYGNMFREFCMNPKESYVKRGDIKYIKWDYIHRTLMGLIMKYNTNECIRLFDSKRSLSELALYQTNNINSQTIEMKNNEEIDNVSNDLFDRILGYGENRGDNKSNEEVFALFVKDFFRCIIRTYKKSQINSEIYNFTKDLVKMIYLTTKSLGNMEEQILNYRYY